MPKKIKLRTGVFSKAARLAGFTSDYALARAMDVNRSTVARVLGGELQPGPAFIGGALTALAPMQFDDLFEVVSSHDDTPDDTPDDGVPPDDAVEPSH
ncbi:transcriptional regulator [Saccharothrix sp. NRRL B-16314]|uniref:transcriptional regulator n=1 Tax=Saccharothrix sp. NRRL B-16314 TaxID=1463825 RepID=UPI000A969936|nr:transcriptional regulator [Saccharothrix sp. NRRL B-16314]